MTSTKNPTNFSREECQESKQQDIYLFAGMLSNIKGINQILDFCDSQPTKQFHFAGKVVNKEILKRIEDRHTYLGEIPHNEMPELLRRYKYFMINPQWTESFSLILMEAYLSGCQIVKFQRTYTTGLESYDIPMDKMAEKCYASPEVFWKKINGVIEKCLNLDSVKKQRS